MFEANIYNIQIGEVLDEKWEKYFIPFTLLPGREKTILNGFIHDQAEMFGVLLRIRDLGLTLISLSPVSE